MATGYGARKFSVTIEGPPGGHVHRGQSGLGWRELQSDVRARLHDYGEGRRCATEGCGTILRSSNPGPLCSLCQEKAARSQLKV